VSGSAIAAPAGTPKPLIDLLNAEFVKAMRAPDIVAKLRELGVVVVANTPEQFASAMAADTELLGKVVRESGARAD
jgi:tripartite-type tricarboxylate transporter receptor subunit TctC